MCSELLLLVAKVCQLPGSSRCADHSVDSAQFLVICMIGTSCVMHDAFFCMAAAGVPDLLTAWDCGRLQRDTHSCKAHISYSNMLSVFTLVMQSCKIMVMYDATSRDTTVLSKVLTCNAVFTGPVRYEHTQGTDEQPHLHSLPTGLHSGAPSCPSDRGSLWGHGFLSSQSASHCLCLHLLAHLLRQTSPGPSSGCLAGHARGMLLLCLVFSPRSLFTTTSSTLIA